MKHKLPKIFTSLVIVSLISINLSAQVFEWRLVNPVLSAVDPDGAGPATGSATFKMQLHTVSGSVSNINTISVGWLYQSLKSMIPTTPGCATVSNPANVTVSPFFMAGGFSYTTVQQCNPTTQTTGGQLFDKISAGTLDGTAVTINTTWVDVYTVTLWTLASSTGGYVAINSGSGGSPAPLGSYSIADVSVNEYIVNSLTYTTPLSLAGVVPVTFTKFNAQCTGNGALISWSTANEINSSYYEIERSKDGTTGWVAVGKVDAAGQSSTARDYQQVDLGSAGNAFYRIKQVDKDGRVSYTDVARTNCESKLITTIIYPVPAKDRLNVVINADRAFKTQLLVYDGIGQVVRKLDATIVSGNNNFSFNLINLPSGHYTVRSTDASLNLNKPFTITH
ncbi:MAG: T9SS type A sorting domain-containing protein [Ferruginibacter sp.]